MKGQTLLLKEEPVKTEAFAIETFGGMIPQGFNQDQGGVSSNAFEVLFNQIVQKQEACDLRQTEAKQTETLGQVLSGGREENPSLASPEGSPIARLEAGLRSSNKPLKDFSLPPSAKEELKETLVKSGFSAEDAEEMIKRASQDDGSVNMGAMFELMPQYEVTEGPVFEMQATDRPLLIQALKDLGVSEADIEEFVNSLPQKGNKLLVSGLPELLSKAKGGKVDQKVLGDLLGRLGLDKQEVQTLLTQAGAGQGELSPKSFMAMLQVAADRQDKGMQESLKSLASKLKVNPVQVDTAGDAARIKAQVLKNLEINAGALAPQDKGDIAKAFGNALKALGGEAVQAAVQSQTDAQTQAAVAQSGSVRERPEPQQPVAGGGKAAAADSKAANDLPSTSKVAQAGAGATVGERLNQAGQALSAKRTLPSYVVRQVSDQITQMAKTSQSSLQLALKPAHLGQLNLELSIKDGLIKATVMAETVAAKNALESGMEQLKGALSQQGIKLERLEVMVNPDTQGGQQQKQAQFGAGGQKQGSGNFNGKSDGQGQGGAADDESLPGQMAATRLAGGRGISLFA
jgi:flagellar hook-length control protein FliK